MKIVYMGTADFGIPALERLMSEQNTISGIVTTPPRARGRWLKIEESSVARYAQEHNLQPILTPENLRDSGFLKALVDLDADLYVVIAYKILPEEVFSIPPLGTINVHASLLPRFRGPAPIQRAIEAGETETGVSVFRINKGIDTGKIICQKALTIGEQETTPELNARLSILGAEALLEACRDLQHNTVRYLEQDNASATRAPKLSKQESLLEWDNPAVVLFNKIRAFKPFPGTKTFFQGKQLGIEWAIPIAESSGMDVGTICEVTPDWFEVACRGSRLRVLNVKPEGKRSMSVKAFLNGTVIQKGMKLG